MYTNYKLENVYVLFTIKVTDKTFGEIILDLHEFRGLPECQTIREMQWRVTVKPTEANVQAMLQAEKARLGGGGPGPKGKEEDKDKVTLMTIHSAKGLEFPYVHLVGLEEKLFPSQMSLTSRADLEEERRLFYVAITRAEKEIHLSFASSRYRWGSLIFCEPSRFIEEIDEEFLEYTFQKGSAVQQEDSFEQERNNYSSGGNYYKKKSTKPHKKKTPPTIN